MGFTERQSVPFPHRRVLLDESELAVDNDRIDNRRNNGTLRGLGISLNISWQMLLDYLLKDEVSWLSEGSFPSTTADIESPRLTKVVPLLRITPFHVVIFKVNVFWSDIASQPVIVSNSSQQAALGTGF
jgi:hypothetical protein